MDQERLYQTCRLSNVSWVEDPTNSDYELTVRNTIRHLFRDHEKSLPTALRPKSIASLNSRMKLYRAQIQAEATILLRKCSLEIDKRTGAVSFHGNGFLHLGDDAVLSTLLEMIMSKSSPQNRIRSSALRESIFRMFRANSTQKFTVGLIMVSPIGREQWLLERRPFARNEQREMVLMPKTWTLWDGRWWIRFHYIRRSDETAPLLVRPLEASDLKFLNSFNMDNKSKQSELVDFLSLPSSQRYTVPLLVHAHDPKILSLPTIGVTFDKSISVTCNFISDKSGDILT